jgi:hypothetical protein
MSMDSSGVNGLAVASEIDDDMFSAWAIQDPYMYYGHIRLDRSAALE